MPSTSPPARWPTVGGVRRRWFSLADAAGNAWYRRHPVSRVWWLMARRTGLWYAIRYVRVTRPAGPPDPELAALAAARPGTVVAKVSREGMIGPGPRPAHIPRRLWHLWHPHGKLPRGDGR